jgi:hypothetical protein
MTIRIDTTSLLAGERLTSIVTGMAVMPSIVELKTFASMMILHFLAAKLGKRFKMVKEKCVFVGIWQW